MLSPNARAPKERIFSTAVRPKKEKKGPLDKYLINGPPNITHFKFWTCERFHDGAAAGMLVVVLLLTLSLSMYDGEFDHGGGGGGGGGPAAAAAAAVVAVDDDWRQKRPATRASMVA